MATRVALIGVGRFGRRLLPALVSRFDVALCCIRGSQETTEWLRRFHPTVEQTSSLERVLSDVSIDGVVVATPIETHGAIACAALAADKHVFVEKPVATSASEARALARLARERGACCSSATTTSTTRRSNCCAKRWETRCRLSRLNWRKLGTFESDLFWNLASHEVSIALALMAGTPCGVELLAARGVEFSRCDVARSFAQLRRQS